MDKNNVLSKLVELFCKDFDEMLYFHLKIFEDRENTEYKTKYDTLVNDCESHLNKAYEMGITENEWNECYYNYRKIC